VLVEQRGRNGEQERVVLEVAHPVVHQDQRARSPLAAETADERLQSISSHERG
jgi:hypothetical protein